MLCGRPCFSLFHEYRPRTRRPGTGSCGSEITSLTLPRFRRSMNTTTVLLDLFHDSGNLCHWLSRKWKHTTHLGTDPQLVSSLARSERDLKRSKEGRCPRRSGSCSQYLKPTCVVDYHNRLSHQSWICPLLFNIRVHVHARITLVVFTVSSQFLLLRVHHSRLTKQQWSWWLTWTQDFNDQRLRRKNSWIEKPWRENLTQLKWGSISFTLVSRTILLTPFAERDRRND